MTSKLVQEQVNSYETTARQKHRQILVNEIHRELKPFLASANKDPLPGLHDLVDAAISFDADIHLQRAVFRPFLIRTGPPWQYYGFDMIPDSVEYDALGPALNPDRPSIVQVQTGAGLLKRGTAEGSRYQEEVCLVKVEVCVHSPEPPLTATPPSPPPKDRSRPLQLSRTSSVRGGRSAFIRDRGSSSAPSEKQSTSWWRRLQSRQSNPTELTKQAPTDSQIPDPQGNEMGHPRQRIS